ncbi:MAG: helix-turn-helix domain-containing protein [Chloroflexi bacterium]|nr:helix-turn-helix domain-containing protein [Chloroflexota bacterium]
MTPWSDAETDEVADELEGAAAANPRRATPRPAPAQTRGRQRAARATDTSVVDNRAEVFVDEDPTLSVAEAARLLGRDRTRIYALLRSGDLVSTDTDEPGAGSGPLRIHRSSLERWLVAGSEGGRPLSARNAWALVGLASGDQPFSEKCVGLLEHAEELSRTRARLARERLVDLAPRLRRRHTAGTS